jgi:hypothetical protein
MTFGCRPVVAQPPAAVLPPFGSARSVHSRSSSRTAFDSSVSLLPPPPPSPAPTRPHMPSGCSRPAPSSTLGGAYGFSSQSPPEWVLELTRRMDHLERCVALFDPSMISSATTQSSQLPISDTQSPWILDSRASFDMTHDSTRLGSLSSLPFPMSVKIDDDTPLPVVRHETLRTP